MRERLSVFYGNKETVSVQRQGIIFSGNMRLLEDAKVGFTSALCVVCELLLQTADIYVIGMRCCCL